MRKKSFIALSVAISLMLTPMSVFAAEENEVNLSSEGYNAEKQLPIAFDSDVEIKQQIPVEITDFPMVLSEENVLYAAGSKLNLQNGELIDGPAAYAVVAGRTQDYLSETGDLKFVPLSINPGVYVQAQLTQPSSPSIDYDLYILDAEGNILVGSENITTINGTSGTLPESVGYITQGTEAATYYLAVLSANGGSANEVFTLDYSVSNVYDQLEPSENAMSSLPFTFGTDGSSIQVTNLSSPVDNDWFVLDVPDERIYDNLILSISTESANICRFEVYQNLSSSGYAMSQIASSTSRATVSVSTGKYYVRVCNDKSKEDYNENDIQTYTFTVLPKLRAEGITVTEYDGNEGVNRFVQYPGYSRKFFRTKGWIKVTGYVTATDPTTSKVYGVSDYSVTAVYRNPYWEANNTPDYAIRTENDVTDSTGEFIIQMDLPPAMGVQTWNAGLTTQYFDMCDFDVKLTDQPSICYKDTIVNYLYSLYN